MKNPGLAHNEEERLVALKELDILDTPAEKQYDNITALAAYICDVPIALINLVDKTRQWTKSRYGCSFTESKREASFCAHAILNPYELMEVEDARRDARFKDNPMVLTLDDPVIFYAGYPLKDSFGHVFGTLCIIDHQPKKLDDRQKNALITLGNQVELLLELRLKNNELEKSKANLKYHNGLLKNFAGAVSHDLKMPLANTILTVDILKTKYADKLDKKALEYLDRLKQSSFGMSDYISNILEYYETENISSLDYSKDPFSLKEFLEDIVDMLNIEADCEINLPRKDFSLICNRSALEQIFLNLLGNSLKYNDKDKTIISVKAKEFDTFYAFSVTDNGMGIPKEKQATVFNLFSIATDRDNNGKKGHGIGLSTVKKIVQKLGGEVKLISEPGKFSTFEFTIKKPDAQN